MVARQVKKTEAPAPGWEGQGAVVVGTEGSGLPPACEWGLGLGKTWQGHAEHAPA